MTSGRAPLRLISIAWGDEYVRDFLDYCLPAVLAPGNLPVLCEHFDVEFVFVTELAQYEQVRRHPAYVLARTFCRFKLVSLDDLVATRGSYGMSITYAFYRGFEDLGPKMTDCYLVFVHADFILADGCYRGLIPHLLAGERLVFSPSYCVEAESVRPVLVSMKNSEGTVLSVSPRQMARLILDHRHLSIRGKTVNQQLFSLDYIEQFYWYVDSETLIAQQFPAALIAMKPEVWLSELQSYWDYGVIADFCPSMEISTLNDSDDYVMLELRERENPKGVLSFGWPTPERIASRLLAVVTDYTATIGKETFVVHCGEVLPRVDSAKQSLQAYVSRVLACLPDPLPSHLDHVQWNTHHAGFQLARQRFLEQQLLEPNKTASGMGQKRSDDVDQEAKSGEIAAHGNLQPDETTANHSSQPYAQAIFNSFVSRAVNFKKTYDSEVQVNLQGGRPCTGLAKEATQAALELTNLRAQVIASVEDYVIEVEQHARSLATLLAVYDAQNSKATLLQKVSSVEDKHEPISVAEPLFASLESSTTESKRRPWHWMYAPTRLVEEILSEKLGQLGQANTLLLTGELRPFSLPPNSCSVIAAIHTTGSHLETRVSSLSSKGVLFDLCLIDGTLENVSQLKRYCDAVQPLMRSGGAILAIFMNPDLRQVPIVDPNFAREAFPIHGQLKVVFSGSRSSALAFRIRNQIVPSITARLKIRPTISRLLAFALSTPFALIAAYQERTRTLDSSNSPPMIVTSIAVEITAT